MLVSQAVPSVMIQATLCISPVPRGLISNIMCRCVPMQHIDALASRRGSANQRGFSWAWVELHLVFMMTSDPPVVGEVQQRKLQTTQRVWKGLQQLQDRHHPDTPCAIVCDQTCEGLTGDKLDTSGLGTKIHTIQP